MRRKTGHDPNNGSATAVGKANSGRGSFVQHNRPGPVLCGRPAKKQNIASRSVSGGFFRPALRLIKSGADSAKQIVDLEWF
jgi:hypothetical protein